MVFDIRQAKKDVLYALIIFLLKNHDALAVQQDYGYALEIEIENKVTRLILFRLYLSTLSHVLIYRRNMCLLLYS